MKAVRLSHTISVPLPFEEAVRCFTPEGERSWIDGWDPLYPAGRELAGDDGDALDTVWLTAGTTWVVTERTGDLRRYARVAAGESAGTVTVGFAPDGERTAVEVTYALTALSEAGEEALDELAGHYPEHIDGWARAIADRLLP
jgi:hypothetical protein